MHLDHLGYVQQERAEREILFTFLAERYERRSVCLSSNLGFSKWGQILKYPMPTMARLTTCGITPGSCNSMARVGATRRRRAP